MTAKNTDTTKSDQLREELRQHLGNNPDVKQATIAKKLMCSPAKLSSWLSGRYKANDDDLCKQLRDYLDLWNERKKTATFEIKFTETDHARKVIDIVRFTHSQKEVSLIYSRAGLGKSTALEYYRDHNSNVIMVTCFAAMTPWDIVSIIADEIKEKTKGGYGPTLRRITKKLKESEICLLIDEAQHCSIKVLEAVRYMHDTGKVAIIFSGNDLVYNAMVGKSETKFDQIFSRFLIQHELKAAVTKNDISKIITAAGLSPTREMVEYLNGKIQNNSFYRKIRQVLLLATMKANAEARAVVVDDLEDAMSFQFSVA